MDRYRTLWLFGWGALTLACMGVGLLIWSLSSVVALYTVGAVAAGAATAGYYTRDDKVPMPRGPLMTVTATQAGAGGVGMVAVPVLVTMAGPLALPMLLLAVITSPWAFRWLERQSLPGGQSAMETSCQQEGQHDEVWETTALAVVESPAPTFAQPPAVRDLSDQELCQVWRVSFRALHRAHTTASRQRVVSLRQAYLDEFERRNPAALSAWLHSGARAASGPDKYLAHPQDWKHRDAS
ncbi:MAG: hypothetical protein H0V42_11090 [Nocardioidaceae bacterium]|nr:hypothetical protein [Nocardioidaceae bacterium]